MGQLSQSLDDHERKVGGVKRGIGKALATTKGEVWAKDEVAMLLEQSGKCYAIEVEDHFKSDVK